VIAATADHGTRWREQSPEPGGAHEDPQFFEGGIPIASLELFGQANTSRHPLARSAAQPDERSRLDTRETKGVNHTIFEGTSEIHQPVIARAISGLRIE
jgi:hypothetical protein